MKITLVKYGGNKWYYPVNNQVFAVYYLTIKMTCILFLSGLILKANISI